MNHIKKNLDQIGFAFSPQEEVERKALIHRKIADIKRKQKRMETTVKLYNPTNLAELQETYRGMNREIIKLESEL